MQITSGDDLKMQADLSTVASRPRLSWTDFQLVLAVAQAGQLSLAAKLLVMSHVTLLRKLASIESRLKVRLFDRTRGHYAPTAAGDALVQAALAMAPLAQQAEMRVLGQDLRPSGHVRVTAAAVIVSHLLPPVLRQFAVSFPDVTLEFIATRDHLSLSRREADVALRVSDKVPEWLVGRQLVKLDFRVFGLKQPGLRQPIRPLPELLDKRRWIAFDRDARDLKFDRWIETTVPERSVVLRVDAFDHALAMVRAGLGIALLPDFVRHTCPDLQPLSENIAELRTPLWLITHKELRDAMRVKVVMRAIGPAVAHAVRGGGE